MHFSPFDHYLPRESVLHALEARPKVVATLLFALSVVLLPDGAWMGFLLAWGLLVAASAAGGVGMGYLLKRSLVALPFLLPALSILFTLPGRPLFRLALGPWLLTATESGAVRFLSVLLRSWLSVQAAILLTAVTPFPEVIHALHHLRFPRLIVAVIAFMYRYLFVLGDEALRLLRARQSRSARVDARRGGGTLRWRAGVAGGMAGQLFLRSYERSERVYAAMASRGYRGELLVMHPHALQRRDWLFLLLAAVGLALVQCLGRCL